MNDFAPLKQFAKHIISDLWCYIDIDSQPGAFTWPPESSSGVSAGMYEPTNTIHTLLTPTPLPTRG